MTMPLYTMQHTERVELLAPIVRTGLRATEDAKKAAAQGFYVKGFASMAGEDRGGHDIPPDKFDIDTFMKNPQLWFNHQLYIRPDTGTEVPAGLIESASVAKVAKRGAKFDIVDVRTKKTIETVDGTKRDDFILNDGDTGLWVIAKVMEPELIDLVNEGRLNAFSWAGVLQRDGKGRIENIDIREVSLVFLPANAMALFTVGKELLESGAVFLITQDGLVYPLERDGLADATFCFDAPANVAVAYSSDGKTALQYITKLESADADMLKFEAIRSAPEGANLALMKSLYRSLDGVPVYELAYAFPEPVTREMKDTLEFGTDNKAKGGKKFPWQKSDDMVTLKRRPRFLSGLRRSEAELLGDDSGTTLSEEESALLDTKKGGELDMTIEELQEAIGGVVTKAISPISETLTALTKRVDGIEAARKSDDTATAPETQDAATQGGTTDVANAEPAQATTAPATEPAAANAGGNAQGGTSEETAQAAPALTLDQITEAVGGIVQKAVAPVETELTAMSKRIDALENAPAPSRAVGEGANTLDFQEIKKSLAEKPKEEQLAISKRAVGAAILPPGGFNQDRG